VLGDVFIVAGQTQTYVVKTAVASLTPAAVEIDPPLKANATTNPVGTLKASHVVNLAFQHNPFAFANRPLSGESGLGTRIMTTNDIPTGISLRLEVSRQYKQVMWDFDILWGGAPSRREAECLDRDMCSVYVSIIWGWMTAWRAAWYGSDVLFGLAVAGCSDAGDCLARAGAGRDGSG
jgi:hypothetical protein